MCIKHKMGVYFFSTTFVRNILPSDKYLARYAEIRVEAQACVHGKCPLLLPDFNQNWNVLPNVIKFPNINFVKIRSGVPELIHTDRQTWQSEQVHFCNFFVTEPKSKSGVQSNIKSVLYF
jgi:hypothetical protein